MRVADIILDQLGGRRFVVMTGSKNFISDGNTLRMSLAKNASKANRLEITLNGHDLYDIRFYRFTPARFSTRGGAFRMYDEKTTEIKSFNDIYCDQLQEIFTQITGLYTHF